MQHLIIALPLIVTLIALAAAAPAVKKAWAAHQSRRAAKAHADAWLNQPIPMVLAHAAGPNRAGAQYSAAVDRRADELARTWDDMPVKERLALVANATQLDTDAIIRLRTRTTHVL